jgi:hypothetical protein
MTDFIFIAIVVGFFAVAWGYACACDHLEERP